MSSNDQSRHCNLSKDKNQQSSSTISRYSIIVKQQQPNHMDSPITKTLNSSFYSDYNNSNNNDNSNGKTNSTPATTASKKIENNYGIQNRNQIYIKPQIPSTRLFWIIWMKNRWYLLISILLYQIIVYNKYIHCWYFMIVLL